MPLHLSQPTGRILLATYPNTACQACHQKVGSLIYWRRDAGGKSFVTHPHCIDPDELTLILERQWVPVPQYLGDLAVGQPQGSRFPGWLRELDDVIGPLYWHSFGPKGMVALGRSAPLGSGSCCVLAFSDTTWQNMLGVRPLPQPKEFMSLYTEDEWRALEQIRKENPSPMEFTNISPMGLQGIFPTNQLQALASQQGPAPVFDPFAAFGDAP